MSGICSFTVLLGRILLSTFFIWNGISNLFGLDEAIKLVAGEQLPYASSIALGASILEVIGGLSLLIGYKARFGTILLLIVLIPTTIIFHDFWAQSGDLFHLHKMMFFKNVSLIGGLLLALAVGPGKCAFDSKCCSTSSCTH